MAVVVVVVVAMADDDGCNTCGVPSDDVTRVFSIPTTVAVVLFPPVFPSSNWPTPPPPPPPPPLWPLTVPPCLDLGSP